MSIEPNDSPVAAVPLDPDSLDRYLAGWTEGGGRVYRMLIASVVLALVCTAFVQVPVSLRVSEVEIRGRAGDQVTRMVADTLLALQIELPRHVHQMLLRSRASSLAVRSDSVPGTIISLGGPVLERFEVREERGDRVRIRIPLDARHAGRLAVPGRLHAEVVIARVSLASWLLGKHRFV